ncbi:MAG: cysteine hydrolase, partial [Chloroflexi bacterium]|nr:cysteine hydrolase [Chloroflexota bacterium]
MRHLKPLAWSDLLADPPHTALFSVDLINGFCYEGNLASLRVARIVPATAQLFAQAYARGLRQFVLIQEWHDEQAEEFKAFAPHGIRHTREAQTVAALASLPFADTFTIMHKDSVDSAAGTELDAWLDAHPLDTVIVVGDCT